MFFTDKGVVYFVHRLSPRFQGDYTIKYKIIQGRSGSVKKKQKIHNPYMNFKGWLRSNNLTYTDVSEVLGISKATLSAKINGTSDFFLSEVKVLKNRYNLSYDIFFDHVVA